MKGTHRRYREFPVDERGPAEPDESPQLIDSIRSRIKKELTTPTIDGRVLRIMARLRPPMVPGAEHNA